MLFLRINWQALQYFISPLIDLFLFLMKYNPINIPIISSTETD